MSLSDLGKQLQTHVNRVERSYRKAIDKVADDITKDSKEIIRDFIRTTPSGIVPGKKDRIWTGYMLNNADSKKTSSGTNYTIEYGWFGFTNPESPGDYVQLQEEGGKYVATGMHSFAAVQNNVRDILLKYQKGAYFGNV